MTGDEREHHRRRLAAPEPHGATQLLRLGRDRARGRGDRRDPRLARRRRDAGPSAPGDAHERDGRGHRQRDPRLPRGPRDDSRVGGRDGELASAPTGSTAAPSPPAAWSGSWPTVGTWFAAVWIIDLIGGHGLALQAATGLPAILVLLVVMNWFFHLRLLDRVEVAPPPAPPRAARGRGITRRCAERSLGLGLLGVHLDLPRGLRDRHLPPEPARHVRRRASCSRACCWAPCSPPRRAC